MAGSPLGKQTAGCNLPHDWLMSLAIDVTALCDMWSEIDTNRCYLLVLVKTKPLLATSWLPAHPPPSYPVGVLLVLATPVKKLPKMVGNSASYSPNSWWIDRL